MEKQITEQMQSHNQEMETATGDKVVQIDQVLEEMTEKQIEMK